MVFVTAKLIAPCSGPSSSTLKPASAYAATPISSNQTNMLKRSPVRAKPVMPAQKTSIRTSKCSDDSRRYAHEYASASSTSPDASAAMPAPNGSATKPIPIATSPRGFQPPNQCSRSPRSGRTMIASEQPSDAAAAASAIEFLTRRGATWSLTAIAAAPSSGIVVGRGSSQDMLSAAHLGDLLGVGGPRLRVDVEREREDQADDGDADDDVRERERLHDRVDGGRPDHGALEDRRAPAAPVADREQEDVRRRLRHSEAEREVDQVAAGGRANDPQ